jgi:protein involved in polysaccharide export with SLBB domain
MLKNNFKSISIFLILLSLLPAQISISDINKITNQQLDKIKSELNTEMAQDDSTGFDKDLDQSSIVEIDASEVQSVEVQSVDENYFGYEYFKRDISFFDNIPTPANYKLGPGDEIIISLWGEKNSRESLMLNKDGMIFYTNIGFINLSNLSLESAEQVLFQELSKVYSTLKDNNNPTKLMISLGKLKSMNIYFSGNISKPGINLIHPFSDIFSSIIQAGGININGTLREIQLIRNNQVIEVIDFYAFFMDGRNNFSNTKIIDGDVIHIPTVQKRVLIDGEINRPGYYEIVDGESVEHLIEYAGGTTPIASSGILIKTIVPLGDRVSDDFAMSSQNTFINESSQISLNNGDEVSINKIGPVESTVDIYGIVKQPGQYSAINSSLKDILDLAGGFEDPIFSKRMREELIVLRKNSEEFSAKEFLVNYRDSNNFPLMPGDKIFVYEDPNYDNSELFSIFGEVNKPGYYPLTDGLALTEAVRKAGGLTENGSINNISLTAEFESFDQQGNKSITKEPIGNISLNYVIGKNNSIKIGSKSNLVKVQGSVYNPGLIAVNNSRMTVKDVIELAGGYKKYSLRRQTYVVRSNGEINSVGIMLGRAMRVNAGDSIFVPENPNPQDFNPSAFLADFATTLANIIAILTIIDNNRN